MMCLDVGWMLGGVADSFFTAVGQLSEPKKVAKNARCRPLNHSVVCGLRYCAYLLAIFAKYEARWNSHLSCSTSKWCNCVLVTVLWSLNGTARSNNSWELPRLFSFYKQPGARCWVASFLGHTGGMGMSTSTKHAPGCPLQCQASDCSSCKYPDHVSHCIVIWFSECVCVSYIQSLIYTHSRALVLTQHLLVRGVSLQLWPGPLLMIGTHVWPYYTTESGVVYTMYVTLSIPKHLVLLVYR